MATITLADFASNTTLTGGNTYLMYYDINANGYALTFDCTAGDIIIKRKGDYAFAQLDVINTTNSTAAKRVRWTVWDDNSIGDAAPGSTGTPVKCGFEIQSIATVAQGYYYGSNFTANFWQINYAITSATNLRIIYHNAGTVSWQNIEFKNCDYTYNSVSIALFSVVGSGTATFKYITYDNTNSVFGTINSQNAFLLSTTYTTAIDYIYIWNTAGTATEGPQPIRINGNSTTSYSYINITDIWGGAGFYLNTNLTTVVISHCKTNFALEGSVSGSGQGKVTFKNCLFKDGRGISTQRGVQGYRISWAFNNCSWATGMQYCTYGDGLNYAINILNCALIGSATSIMGGTAPTTQTNNYNALYGNGGAGNYTGGANDFTANPSFGNILGANSVIDADFVSYGPPNGYKPSTALYQDKGSDSWDNLSVDETIYSPDGLRHN